MCTDEVLSLSATLANPDGADTQPALTRMLAVSQVKLGWIEDMPLFLWQVQCSRTARMFLDIYDTSQTEPHRVSLRYGEGDLRSDMEAWASGGAQSVQ